jgi:hypothetical protein
VRRPNASTISAHPSIIGLNVPDVPIAAMKTILALALLNRATGI